MMVSSAKRFLAALSLAGLWLAGCSQDPPSEIAFVGQIERADDPGLPSYRALASPGSIDLEVPRGEVASAFRHSTATPFLMLFDEFECFDRRETLDPDLVRGAPVRYATSDMEYPDTTFTEYLADGSAVEYRVVQKGVERVGVNCNSLPHVEVPPPSK